MLPAMSVSDWFRRLFASRSELAEEAAAEREDFGKPDEAEADLERAEYTPRLFGGGFAGSEAAEAAEAELESEAAPPDLAP
jgi:hypothetical protein